MASTDVAPAPEHGPQQVVRPLDRAWVGGVCAGLADHLGVPVVVLRVAFAVLAAWRLTGVVAYLVLWLFLPRAQDVREAPGLDAARRRGLRGGAGAARPGLVQEAGVALAIALVGGGLTWFLQAVGWGIDAQPFLLGVLAAVGVTLVWWQADRATGRDPAEGRRRWLEPLLAHWTTVLTLLVGVALLAVVVGVTVGSIPDVGDLARTLWAIALSVVALLVLAAPWLVRFRRSLALARELKLVSDARADMAAHLHDSVLQTLALIQRQADQPREVVRLARRQERELRAWLYGEADAPAETLRAALDAAAQEIEDSFPVTVECVGVGDAELTPPLAELVKAAREAMLNAAKHSGSPTIDVYAEAADETVEVFVRDRGTGFDPDAIGEDRLGVRMSIIDRVRRHGGVARIRSTPGRGTEVTLEMRP